jgi:DNA-binding NarL/FixJ family response regulator
MDSNRINICIVQHNRDKAILLSEYLNGRQGCVCKGIFLTGEDAVEQVPKLTPAVVLLDINLPGMGGVECIRQLKHYCKGLQIMIYTECEDEATVFAALSAGANAYVLQTSPLTELAGHISELCNGGSPVSSSIARKIILSFQKADAGNQEKYGVTKREREILVLLGKGCSYDAVAGSLFISSKTVRKHIYNIYEKLQVNNKIEAVNKFFGRK